MFAGLREEANIVAAASDICTENSTINPDNSRRRFEAVTLIIDTALGAASNATANPLMNLILAAVSNDAIV